MGEPNTVMYYRFMSKAVNRGEPGEEEKKSNEIAGVVANETAGAQKSEIS